MQNLKVLKVPHHLRNKRAAVQGHEERDSNGYNTCIQSVFKAVHTLLTFLLHLQRVGAGGADGRSPTWVKGHTKNNLSFHFSLSLADTGFKRERYP